MFFVNTPLKKPIKITCGSKCVIAAIKNIHIFHDESPNLIRSVSPAIMEKLEKDSQTLNFQNPTCATKKDDFFSYSKFIVSF